MNHHCLKRIFSALNVFFIAGLFFTNDAYTGQYESTERTQYEAAAYLWGPTVRGNTSGGLPIKLTFGEILKDLKFGYMGAFRVIKGKWSFVSDVIYLDLKADKASTIPVPLNNGQVITVFGNADVKLTGWFLNFDGAYQFFEKEHFTSNVLAGARYLDLNAQSNLRLDAQGYTRAINIDLSGSTWDAIGGIKGLVKLNDKWVIPYYVDAGAGQSKFTWQTYSGLSYVVSWGSINLFYRYASWKFKQNATLSNINFGGPLLGVVYKFH